MFPESDISTHSNGITDTLWRLQNLISLVCHYVIYNAYFSIIFSFVSFIIVHIQRHSYVNLNTRVMLHMVYSTQTMEQEPYTSELRCNSILSALKWVFFICHNDKCHTWDLHTKITFRITVWKRTFHKTQLKCNKNAAIVLTIVH